MTTSRCALEVNTSLRNLITYNVTLLQNEDNKIRDADWNYLKCPWSSNKVDLNEDRLIPAIFDNLPFKNPNGSCSTSERWAMLFASISCLLRKDLETVMSNHERFLLSCELLALENSNAEILMLCQGLRTTLNRLEKLAQGLKKINTQTWSKDIISAHQKRLGIVLREVERETNNGPSYFLSQFEDLEKACENGELPSFLKGIQGFRSMKSLTADSALQLAVECMKDKPIRKRKCQTPSRTSTKMKKQKKYVDTRQTSPQQEPQDSITLLTRVTPPSNKSFQVLYTEPAAKCQAYSVPQSLDTPNVPPQSPGSQTLTLKDNHADTMASTPAQETRIKLKIGSHAPKLSENSELNQVSELAIDKNVSCQSSSLFQKRQSLQANHTLHPDQSLSKIPKMSTLHTSCLVSKAHTNAYDLRSPSYSTETEQYLPEDRQIGEAPLVVNLTEKDPMISAIPKPIFYIPKSTQPSLEEKEENCDAGFFPGSSSYTPSQDWIRSDPLEFNLPFTYDSDFLGQTEIQYD